ncbi:hypothetical protein HYR99_01805 [Candidatus Poribacteria bacterium]|nr:hypothetical protein [Candidatus Poribacteria bacterium]
MRTDISEIVSTVQWKIDSYDIKTAIAEAFSVKLGESEVEYVDISEYPNSYGARVWLKRSVDADVKNLVRELEKEFKKQLGIFVSIGVEQGKPVWKTK